MTELRDLLERAAGDIAPPVPFAAIRRRGQTLARRRRVAISVGVVAVAAVLTAVLPHFARSNLPPARHIPLPVRVGVLAPGSYVDPLLNPAPDLHRAVRHHLAGVPGHRIQPGSKRRRCPGVRDAAALDRGLSPWPHHLNGGIEAAHGPHRLAHPPPRATHRRTSRGHHPGRRTGSPAAGHHPPGPQSPRPPSSDARPPPNA